MTRQPTMLHAGVYGAVTHYLKAVKATGSDDAASRVKKMKEMPINDFVDKDGKIRDDGRVIRDMYLVEVKTPEEFKVLGTTIMDRARFRATRRSSARGDKRLSAGQGLTQGLDELFPRCDRGELRQVVEPLCSIAVWDFPPAPLLSRNL